MVFLTVRGNTLSGNVQIGKDLYEIETKGNNQYDITLVDRKGLPAPHSFPDLILTSSQFLVRIRNENTYTMAVARGSLA
jgi:hypothetical protein